MTQINAHYRLFTAAILAILVLTGCVAVAPPVSAQGSDAVPVSILAAEAQEKVLQPQPQSDDTVAALQYMR